MPLLCESLINRDTQCGLSHRNENLEGLDESFSSRRPTSDRLLPIVTIDLAPRAVGGYGRVLADRGPSSRHARVTTTARKLTSSVPDLESIII